MAFNVKKVSQNTQVKTMQCNDRLNKIHPSYVDFKVLLPTTYDTSPLFPSLVTGTELPSTFDVVHSEGTQKNNRKKPPNTLK